MSKYLIILKTELKTQLKQIHLVLGTYLLIPLFFAVLLGWSFQEAFVPEVSIDPIQVSVVNNDEGDMGQLLNDTLASDQLSELIEIVDAEDANFLLNIQPEYSQQLADTLITIQAESNSSSTEESILTQLITAWQQSIVDQNLLASEIATINNQEVTNTLTASLENIANLNLDNLFRTQNYHSETALTSNQFSAVSGMLYVFFLSLGASVGLNTKEEFRGYKKRLGVIPLTPTQKVVFETMNNVIIFGFIAVLYMIIWRLIDNQVFQGNPLFYLAWIFIYALFFQAVNALMMFALSGKISSIVYQVSLIMFMVLGFLPLESIFGATIGNFFSQNFFRHIFQQPIYDYMTSGAIASNISIALGILLVSLILVVLTIAIKRRRELNPA